MGCIYLNKNSELIESILSDNIFEKNIGFLQTILKKKMKFFKNYYKNIVMSTPKTQLEQNLYSNYYIIERITKLLLKENESFVVSVNEKNVPVFGLTILESCVDGNIPETDVIIENIKEIQIKKYISNVEFELLIWSFRYAILIKLYKLYKNDNSDNESAFHLIMLLAKSDTFDLLNITSNCNPIEKLYCKELCQVFSKMDENTRRIYRNRTSKIANKLGKNELSLATEFLNQADFSFTEKSPEKQSHVGYYIFKAYEKLDLKLSPKSYIALISGISAFLALGFSLLLHSYWIWILLFFPFWEFSKILVEIIFTSGQEVTYLPRMDLKNKVPENFPTLMVVSSLLTVPKDIIQLKDKLIRLHFSNLSENIKICALCDLKQSNLPSSAEDKAIIRNANRTINKLNEIYCDKFVLIVRNRTFSQTQQQFTGLERKRGAIEQLVRYIKGEQINFLAFFGNKEFVSKVKYIVALDYDTKALIDTIPELVSIAIHPLNKPEISDGKVVSGYGIITPRITTKLKSSLKSPFAKLVGGVGSSCAYDTFCTNLYQDNFNEGIFSGKGLIDVDSFFELCCGFFPSEQVLSHDILEGSLLRTAFAGDVEFSDGFPATSISYFKRMHRWIRGDVQNINYIFKKVNSQQGVIDNPLNLLDKFKLFDNIRRIITPINIILLFLSTYFFTKYSGCTLALIGTLSVLIPFISGFLSSIINNGIYSISRKYYSGVISQTTEIISQGCFSLLLLPQLAVMSFDAAVRALWRKYVSHKNLLEWTTASQTERGGTSLFSKIQVFVIPELISISLLFTPVNILKLIALFYIFVPVIIVYSDIPYKHKSHCHSPNKAFELSSDLAAMWQFYEDYATIGEHYLPPDNVQFAPVYRICHRTSPTNIGLMMLSILVARDFDLIDSNGLFKRVERILTSVEKLEKFNGNLYNWYETRTLNLSNNPYVSTVDSGNFCCCMVALKEGLKEYETENDGIKLLIVRIGKLIDNTDLSVFFDESKGLFSIGYNPETKSLSPNHYDLLMSEARMTSYFAVAKRLIPKKHWRMLGRTMVRQGLYSGPVSYSGTMFEFFMPELLLQSETGSLSYEGLKFCIHCQKRRGSENGVPFGVSESGYYAFDNALNYQYKAHGIQNLGLKRGLDNELVVSPYSSYLALEYDFDSSYDNLQELKKYGMYGNYGHYEAIDFTKSRSPKTGSIVKSYMAHHVGMSIVAISNAVHDGKIQKRFFKDNYMKSADELLQEKVIAGAVVFEDVIKKQENPKANREEIDTEYYDVISPSQPNIKILCNGEYTLALTDLGACIALYQGQDVYLRTTDLLRRPQGCYFAIEDGDNHTCMTYLPEYINSDEMSVEFNSTSVSYFSNTKELHIGMKVHLHSNLPCEIRQFAIKNVSSQTKNINLVSYIEPVLASYLDNSAHPAFSKLFLKESYDIDSKCVIVSRKSRHSDDEIFCAIGFVEDNELFCNLSREEVLSRPYGVTGVFTNLKSFSKNYNSIPDPCVFVKTNIYLQANEQKELNLFILTALSKEQLYQSIAKIRHDKIVATLSCSIISAASIEGRLVNLILPQILFKKRDCTQNTAAIEANKLSFSALWELGISGDLPIVLVELNNLKANEKIIGYIKCHNVLKLCGITFDLVFSFDDKSEYGRPFFNMLTELVNSLSLCGSISIRGGIHFVDTAGLGSDIITHLQAAAVHIAPVSMIRIGTPSVEFTPIKISTVEKSNIKPDHSLTFGGFDKNSFIINEKHTLPWCNVLANAAFGTLVSDCSLGYTYAINSRENKLTPWFNDTQSDNRGEFLLVRCGEKYYDVCLGATAKFSSEKVVFFGKCDFFDSKVTVTISDKGMCKKIELELTWKAKQKNIEIAFYTEPVLGVSRDNSRMIVFSNVDDCLVANNPANRDISGFMSIQSSTTPDNFITNREAFLSGKWGDNSLSSSNEPCGAVILKHNVIQNKKYTFDFYLSFGKSIKSALLMTKLFKSYKLINQNEISITTPDENLNSIFNYWLDWQALSGRIYARTGFYQNSGAWGFRDQLQDSCGCLLKNPVITKRQIARACTAQFVEGDVLHWWHKLPNNVMRGVRTKYSDDLVWLPYTVCEYIDKTSDTKILGDNIAYCEGIVLKESQHEIYGEVRKTSIKESVYNHCKKALDHAYKLGEHNLILMGCGDWNDSFNGVGIEGKGESVWLSEFMIIVLKRFSEICEIIGDINSRDDYILKANTLSIAVEENCWDGEWYMRAFFDSGEELGSRDCEACQIDSLAQSFAVLAELPNSERNIIGLNSAYSNLVDKKNGIIKLFTPSFQKNEMPVGYATSYPAGIRENGGQYTHGSIWLAIALLQAGQYEKGFELINIISPANKYNNAETAMIYKNEPYYVSADIYTNPQCYGRGGWSIYTGAAAWYYRAIFEWLFGIKIKNKQITISPNIPKSWDEYEVSLNYSDTPLHIVVTKGNKFGMFDNDNPFETIYLDKQKHEIRIILPKSE